MANSYNIGYWFTIGYVPHVVLEKFENDNYRVIYGYPKPIDENEIIMSGVDISLQSD